MSRFNRQRSVSRRTQLVEEVNLPLEDTSNFNRNAGPPRRATSRGRFIPEEGENTRQTSNLERNPSPIRRETSYVQSEATLVSDRGRQPPPRRGELPPRRASPARREQLPPRRASPARREELPPRREELPPRRASPEPIIRRNPANTPSRRVPVEEPVEANPIPRRSRFNRQYNPPTREPSPPPVRVKEEMVTVRRLPVQERKREISPVKEVGRPGRRELSPVKEVNRRVNPERREVSRLNLPVATNSNETLTGSFSPESLSQVNINEEITDTQRRRAINPVEETKRILSPTRSQLLETRNTPSRQLSSETNPYSDIPTDILTSISQYLTAEEKANFTLANLKINALLSRMPIDLYSKQGYDILDIKDFLIKRSNTKLVALHVRFSTYNTLEELKLLEPFLPKLQRLRISYVKDSISKKLAISLNLPTQCTNLVDFTLKIPTNNTNFLSQMPKLKNLYLANNTYEIIPYLPKQLIQLKIKYIISFKDLGILPNLIKLKIKECLMDKVILTRENLPSLKEISLSECTELKSISMPDEKEPSLTALKIKGCYKLNEMKLDNLTTLTNFKMVKCDGEALSPNILNILKYNLLLENVTFRRLNIILDFNILLDLVKLKYLELGDGVKYSNVKVLGKFPSLTTLKINLLNTNEDRDEFSFPQPRNEYTGLKYLELNNPSSEKDFLENFSNFPNLLELTYMGTFSEVDFSPLGKYCQKLRLLKIKYTTSKSLDFLFNCPDLETLDLHDLKLKVLPVLAPHNKLKKLIKPFNLELSAENIEILSSYHNLTYLDVSTNSMTSVSFLKNFPLLETFIAKNSYQLKSFALEGFILDKLKTLKLLYDYNYVGRDSLASVPGVASCPNLRELTLAQLSNLVDVTPVGKCKNLQKLSLTSCARVESLSGLEGCTDLKRITLYMMTGITSLMPLLNCIKIRYLSISAARRISDIVEFSRRYPHQIETFHDLSGRYTDFKDIASMTAMYLNYRKMEKIHGR